MNQVLVRDTHAPWRGAGTGVKPKVERFVVDDPEWLMLVGPEMGDWLNSWSVEEHARYNDQYVAVSVERRVVAADRLATGLQRKLRKLGSPKVLVFLHEPHTCIIYSYSPTLT